MKKIITLALTCVLIAGMLVVISSCAAKSGNQNETLICGITDYEPMNFRDSSGNWTGFDTEFAKLVGDKLNMKVEFQEIEWGNKYNELESGAISCIWNGFTGNASDDGTPRIQLVDMSYSYMLNQQSVVVKAARASEFTSEAALVGKTVAAEKGSAGEAYARDAVGDSGTVLDSTSQVSTFVDVKAGAVDFAVVDILLAQRMAGTGDYSDLTVADITLDSEVYVVGFKKGSDLKKKVNDAIKALYDDGKLMELAKKYGLENQLILDTAFAG
ncbi:MAG: transporter substrate-binding domain-containing protein [Oscillospiraceae bacterium]|nr:transporter substrate-binding domain-containing protein [Oscillospiraceae bacterium]